MVWMGSKSNIAAITALNTTDLQDNIVFAAVTELKFLMLNKSSTATVDNASVWAATPAGRWLLTGGSGSGSSVSSIEIVASLAALQALTSASQDKLYALNTTPPQLFSWDAESTATISDDIIKLTALTNGRMYRIYPAASGGGGGGSTTTVSADPPDPFEPAPEGATWIWAETDYAIDSTKRMITYVGSGGVWIETSARLRRGSGNPTNLGVAVDSQFETYLDSSTKRLWHAYSDGEGGYAWQVDV